MTQIGSVPAIRAVKDQLEALQQKGLVQEWEVPYERILTRLSAAIFFLTPAHGTDPEEIWKALGAIQPPKYRLNQEKQLSQLDWRVEFN